MKINIIVNNKTLDKFFEIDLSDYDTNGFLIKNQKGNGMYIQEETFFNMIENEFNKK